MATAQPGLELLADNSHRALSMLPAYLTVIRDSLLRHANFSRPPYGSWQRYQFDLAIADRLRELERIEAALQASDQAIQGFPPPIASCCKTWTRPPQVCRRYAPSPPKHGGCAILSRAARQIMSEHHFEMLMHHCSTFRFLGHFHLVSPLFSRP